MSGMEILPFDGNFRELSKMIRKAWMRDHRSSIDYKAEYIQHLVTCPHMDKNLTLGGYYKGKLISFILSLNRTVMINGKKYRALLNSLASTDPEWEHLFPYLKIKNYYVKKAIESGYELNFAYAVPGSKNIQIEVKYASKNEYQCVPLGPFSSIVYSLNGDLSVQKEYSAGDTQLQSYKDHDVSECLAIIRRQNKAVALKQEWEIESLRRKLFCTNIRRTEVFKTKGTVKGFISSHVVDFRYPNYNRKILTIDNFFIDILPEDTRRDIVRHFIDSCRRMDIDGISIPNTGYFDPRVVRQEGFQILPFTASRTELFITMFHETVDLSPDTDFYLEIL